jgi:hypothetical protein
MPKTKVAISNRYLLLILAIAAIMVTCVSFTSYINTAQAQTAKQPSSSSTPTPSNASGTTTKQQVYLILISATSQDQYLFVLQ